MGSPRSPGRSYNLTIFSLTKFLRLPGCPLNYKFHFILFDYIDQTQNVACDLKRSVRNCKADIKYAVAARANEKPFVCAALIFEDAVETIFVAAFRTILELVF